MHYLIAKEQKKGGKAVKKLEKIKAVFEKAAVKYKLLFTTHAGHATEFAKEITANGEENVIVAVGGDGTLHEILNGFCDFEKNALALIPFGTGNDFAAAAGIPSDVEEAAKIIVLNNPRYIDYIELSSGLRSLNAVGMGIDVEVLKRTYAGTSKGKTKYLKAFIKTFFKFKSIDFNIEYDGKSEHHFGMIAALGNGRQIGGGIKLFPDAKIDDGYMDLFMVDYLSRPRMLSAFIKLMLGKVNSVKEATAVRVKSAKFTTNEEHFTIQAEGELYDDMPIEASIVGGKLKFYL